MSSRQADMRLLFTKPDVGQRVSLWKWIARVGDVRTIDSFLIPAAGGVAPLAPFDLSGAQQPVSTHHCYIPAAT